MGVNLHDAFGDLQTIDEHSPDYIRLMQHIRDMAAALRARMQTGARLPSS